MQKLDDVIAEFAELDPEEKLELLLEYSETLPGLDPVQACEIRQSNCRVTECQTTVFLGVSMNEGRIHIVADVPRNSPVVRGLVALIVQVVEGATPAEVAEIPVDLLQQLGLLQTLGMTRQRGIQGVVEFIKRKIAKLTQ
ncbi:MAG: SufE family protein [Planctomycetaceae bacterium]